MATLRIPDLAGKVFLVTGASTGIGAAAARALGAQGACVAVHYKSSREAAEAVAADIAAAGGEAWTVAGDVADARTVESIVARTGEHFGRIDGLINNAGAIVRRSPLAELPDALYDEVMDLNVRSVVTACRAAVPWLRRQGGVIVNTTSVAARNGGSTGTGFYAGTKAFVSNITRALAKELVAERIRVNAVAPGVIATPLHDRSTSPEQMASLAATIPMGRIGTPEDCAGAYLYLCSDMLSGYVTGQILEVNGGQLMP
ncbi:SDR family oxidoreductase [Geminicoccaceae bacterium 1502E]|nr:SDR family oxidoreductase [Geminicoccaceae bacterium 1502E]